MSTSPKGFLHLLDALLIFSLSISATPSQASLWTLFILPSFPLGFSDSSSQFSILYTLNLYLWYLTLLWNTGSFCVCVCVCVCTLNQVQFFATPFAVAHQATLSWDFPGKNNAMDCHFLLQGIFPIQGSNQHLNHSQFTTSSWHFRQNSYFPYPYIL